MAASTSLKFQLAAWRCHTHSPRRCKRCDENACDLVATRVGGGHSLFVFSIYLDRTRRFGQANPILQLSRVWPRQYRTHPWSPFPLRRVRPGPGPHNYHGTGGWRDGTASGLDYMYRVHIPFPRTHPGFGILLVPKLGGFVSSCTGDC